MLDLLIPTLVLIWVWAFCALLHDQYDINNLPSTLKRDTALWLCSLVAAFIWHTDKVVDYHFGDEDDSISTLAVPEIAGLLVLSGLLLAGLFLLLSRKAAYLADRGSRWNIFTHVSIDLASTLLLFTLFYSFTPQIYYAYYQLIFDNLEFKIVVRSLFDFGSAMRLMIAGNLESYADYFTAGALWSSLIFTVARNLCSPPLVYRRDTSLIAAIALAAVCGITRLS